MKRRKSFVVFLVIVYLVMSSVSIFGGVLDTNRGEIVVIKTTPTFEKYWESYDEHPYVFKPAGEWYAKKNYIEVSASVTMVWLFFWLFKIWLFSTLLIVIAVPVYSLIKLFKFFRKTFL